MPCIFILQAKDGSNCDPDICKALSPTANLRTFGEAQHITGQDATAHVINIAKESHAQATLTPTNDIEIAADWAQHAAQYMASDALQVVQGSTVQSSSGSGPASGKVGVDMTAVSTCHTEFVEHDTITSASAAATAAATATATADTSALEVSLGTMARASAASDVSTASSASTVEGQLLVEGVDDFELPGVGRVAVVLAPDMRHCGLGVVLSDV